MDSALHDSLDTLVDQIAPQITDRFGADTCVLATKAAVDFLCERGIEALPMMVEVHVMNERWYKALQTARGDEDILAAKERGAHCVAIVENNPGAGRGLRGHLVAIVAHTYLLDLSIGQASRLTKDIHVRPFYVAIPTTQRRSFLRGRLSLTTTQTGGGVTSYLTYRCQPHRHEFLTTPDWTGPSFQFASTALRFD